MQVNNISIIMVLYFFWNKHIKPLISQNNNHIPKSINTTILIGVSIVLKRNNFPHLRFHDLRHSCASILHDKCWDIKDIQTWLGHADISTTANIYTHISASRKNEMAKDIQGILNYKISWEKLWWFFRKSFRKNILESLKI